MIIQPKYRKHFPIAGLWSVGIKRLTQGAIKAIPGAQHLLDEGIENDASWDEIETALKAVNNYKSRPLVPLNTPYFVLKQDRCTVPGLAQKALDLYGEDRGDGRRIYQFPIVFWDDIPDACQRDFKFWQGSKLNLFSTIIENGDRRCSRYEPVKVDPARTRRGDAINRWGGRAIEDVSPCNPNECPHFGEGNCRHETTLYFRVPGLTTGSMYMSMNTKSIYSSIDFAGKPDNPDDLGILDYVKRDFERITGLFDGKPMFWLTKNLQMVSRLDRKTGQSHREEKEIIRLINKDVDTTELLVRATNEAHAKGLPVKDVLSIGDVCRHETDASPQPTVIELRRSLVAKINLFDPPWSPQNDLPKWMESRGYNLSMVKEKEGLETILSEIEKLLNTQEAEEEIPQQESRAEEGCGNPAGEPEGNSITNTFFNVGGEPAS